MLPPKVADQVPALASELVTASLILCRDGDRAPTDATVAGVNEIPLMPAQRSELIGLIIEDLLGTIVALLNNAARNAGCTPEEFWAATVLQRASANP